MSTAPSRGRTVPPRASVAELRARIRALEKPGEQDWSPGAFAAVPAGGLSSVIPPAIPMGVPSVMPPVMPPVIPVGVPAIDAHLPDGGLRLAGLHKIAGAREEWDDAVAAGFCLALLGRLAAVRGTAGGPVSQGSIPRGPIPRGPILWAARRADLYGPGVADLMAVPPGRLILVRARRDDQVLWALEEGLRAHRDPSAGPGGCGLSAVVGEVGEADGTALRRLQLAAERAGRPCFLLRRRLYAGRAAPPRSTSRSTLGAALTHWRVGAVPSSQRGVRGERATGLTGLPGRSRWRVDLLRCRGAAPGTFMVEWDDAAGDFALAAPVCDRPVAPRTAVSAAPGRRAG